MRHATPRPHCNGLFHCPPPFPGYNNRLKDDDVINNQVPRHFLCPLVMFMYIHVNAKSNRSVSALFRHLTYTHT